MDIKERLEALNSGKWLMMPQNLYAQAFVLREDMEEEMCIQGYCDGAGFYVETDTELLAMLLTPDIVVWETDEARFPQHTVDAFDEYFDEDGEVYEGPGTRKEEDYE